MNDMRTQFTERGFVRRARAFPPELAATMADAVWAELQRVHGICRADRSTWTVAEPRKPGSLRKRGVFDTLATAPVVAAISELLGDKHWPHPFSWGDPLVTFPSPGRWNVPTGGWHIDFPARSTLLLKWLAYLAPVTTAGGGTVVLAGSHRLVKQFLEQANPSDPGHSSTPNLFHAPAPNHSPHPRLMTTGGTLRCPAASMMSTMDRRLDSSRSNH